MYEPSPCFEGHTVRAPFDLNWPMKILNTITLSEEEDKTTLTMIVAPPISD